MRIVHSTIAPVAGVVLPSELHCEFGLPETIPRVRSFRVGQPEPIAVHEESLFQVWVIPCEDETTTQEITSLSTADLTRIRTSLYEPPKAMLICNVVEEVCTRTQDVDLLTAQGPHHHAGPFVVSLLQALQIVRTHPAQFERIFYASLGKLHNITSEWLPGRHTGPPLSLDAAAFDDGLALSKQLWRLDSKTRRAPTAAIISNAVKFYQLANSRHEADLVVVLLAISFESLFRPPADKSNSRARRTLAKMISTNKAEYSQIDSFLSENPNKKGALYYRNSVVHGKSRSEPIPDGVPEKFREYARRAIHAVVRFAEQTDIDHADYYTEIEALAQSRFENLSARR